MKELTRAEEQVMQVLWKMKKGFVNDILENFDEPKPAYNTISTIVRILEKKGFVAHHAFGKAHEYYPLMSKKEYTQRFFKGFMKSYFSDSYKALASFLANDRNISISELEEMKQLMEAEINKQKSKVDE
ncbi:MAG: BlaI/MecI/CopY family transcriptional regulator [Bacteroidetes bacterium]|nr:BlaI/MecI/CopY family transcriptional regulator [Bacteroidota bacterium]